MSWNGEQFARWFLDSQYELNELQPLSRLLGERFLEVDSERGYAKVSYEVGSDFRNYAGRIHGGMLSFLFDEAIGAAAFAHVGNRFKCTVDAKASFFRPLDPGPVVVEAWKVHEGKTLLFMEAQMWRDPDKIVARSAATIALLETPS